jgi:hypothetical protein
MMLSSSPDGRSSLKQLQTSLQNGWIQVCESIDELPDHWVMHFDGFYTLKGVGVGIVLIPPECDVLKYVI